MHLNFWRLIRLGSVLLPGVVLGVKAAEVDAQAIKGHVPEVVTQGLAPTGRMPAPQRMQLAIGLPWRNQDGLTQLLQQLYDPASPLYRKFLDPQQFTASFGPTEKDYEAVRQFAEGHGLRVTGTHPNRMILDVSGTVADVEKAFHVNLGIYPHPKEHRNFYAPDREPAPDLAVPVLHVSGLSDFALPHPSSLHIRPTGLHADASPHSGSEFGNYVGLDFRAAYVPGVALTGSGQSVALVEFDTYYPSDITTYLTLAAGGLATNTTTIIPIGTAGENTNAHPGDANTEVALDIDMAIAMAPGLSNVYVYEAPNNSAAGPDDIFSRMATDNLAQQISSSWSGFSDSTIHQAFQEFAAQGQSVFFASGDSDAYVNGANPVSEPVDDPFVTCVGGTTLSTSGPQAAWTAETTWNWLNTDVGTNGSAGGISPNYAIPSWQQGVSMTANQGSTIFRNLPDVALTADKIYIYANGGIGYQIGGTSAASPLWAGFMALVNQQNAMLGNSPVGFFNPTLYALAQSTNYANCFHDITTGNNTNSVSPTQFFAVPGYDLCTGWGTPAGSNLINALAMPADVLQIAPLTGFTVSGAAGGPVKAVSQTFWLTNLGSSPMVWTLNTPVPWLSNSSSGGTLAGGGITNVVVGLDTTAAAGLPAGTYTTNVTFKNTTDGVTQSRLFSLTLVGNQLVQNGGFELGTFSGWTLVGDGGQDNFVGNSNSLPTGSHRHPYNGSSYIHSGSYAAFMGEPTILAHLTQQLATVAGQSYLLSFWLDNPGVASGATPVPNEFSVTWNGNVIFDQANMAEFDFTMMQYVVAATNGTTTLDFGFRNDNDYFGFDDVSVTPVTPPFIQSVVPGLGTITLTVSVQAGATYQVQYTSTLSPASWQNVGGPLKANSNVISIADVLASDPQRFYRVVLVPQ